MNALKFITCGSVDDGKSTLIGRLLVDSRSVLQDQLASVTSAGAHGADDEVDLAALTDGLSAEREQGITIDVAWRYFNTQARKFIIGDSPGHEQYTRNMVTAASSADAAVVLVDATKLDWADPALKLLPQTRRHSLLVHLLRVPSIVVAINKLDAVENPTVAFEHIRAALEGFAAEAGIPLKAVVPISALKGYNVVTAADGWAGYQGPSLLDLLEHLPNTVAETELPFSFAVQWVEKFSSSSDTSQGRRVFWGRVTTGGVQVGQTVRVLQGPQGTGQTATVAQVLDHARQPHAVLAGHSAGIVLDRELDVSRGDWLLAVDASAPGADEFDEAPASPIPVAREVSATIAWLDNEPLVPGRVYWALHGHRWVKAKVRRIVHQIHIETLAETDATQLPPNAIGVVELVLQEPIATLPYTRSRGLGALVLVDTASHATAGAVMLH
ncbi:sulfate adenylyltransferase subunit 1 [Hydrogenophaga sp. OTU3427]|uniref:sulfate adenylyltransferase subunit 1 n=1 Tax=Hydrogenophaga sp. OTU3427 TaxID=3043856 RepID=UPI00313EDD76